MITDLSVIIPVYNAMPLLKRTLDSIFSQKTKYSYEVILVDDGSKDNSVEYIESRLESNIILLQQKMQMEDIVHIWMQMIFGRILLSRR